MGKGKGFTDMGWHGLTRTPPGQSERRGNGKGICDRQRAAALAGIIRARFVLLRAASFVVSVVTLWLAFRRSRQDVKSWCRPLCPS